jgi:hypothetical protein
MRAYRRNVTWLSVATQCYSALQNPYDLSL